MYTVKNTIETVGKLDSRDLSLTEMLNRYNIVGNSDAIRRICRIIDKVASQQTTILITGESGTGKEMIAHAIHLNSNRSARPFICVNCAAIHDTLLESELFGHKRGSFTGAYTNKKGKFQLANGGTLFLDEIGDLSPNAQAKLLRTIETGEIERLGTEMLEKVDVRIISATNKNLDEMVEKGVFREDLMHRINVIAIHIPPLRQRRDDILPLVHHFLNTFSIQNKIPRKRLAPSAEAVLLSYKWPGNVRELRNIVEKISILVDSHIINSQHIAEFLKFPSAVNGQYKTKTFKQAKKCFEKSFITHTLFENGWNISKTAQALALPRSSLYEKMKEYSIRKNPENQTT